MKIHEGLKYLYDNSQIYDTNLMILYQVFPMTY